MNNTTERRMIEQTEINIEHYNNYKRKVNFISILNIKERGSDKNE